MLGRSVCRLGSLLIQNTTESGNPMPVTPPALESTHVTCKQIATLTLDPKVVLTARGDRPMSLKSLEKEWVRETRGRSSATTTQVRTQDRLIPRACQNHNECKGLYVLITSATLHQDLAPHKKRHLLFIPGNYSGNAGQNLFVCSSYFLFSPSVC